MCFYFVLVRGCSPGSPPFLLRVRQSRPDIKPHTVVQPTYQLLNQRANGDAKFAVDTRLEFQATIKLRESREVKYREVSTNCRRVVKFTFRLLYPGKEPRWTLNRRLSGPLSQLGRFEEKSMFPSAGI
jgi:hypothetical protein